MWAFFVAHRKFTSVLLMAVIVLGTLSIFSIDKEANPEINVPFVIVTTPFPGANVLDVEQFITHPLEGALVSLDDIRHLTSTSSLGMSSIALEFEIGVDIDKKIREIQDALSIAKNELPEDVEDSIVKQVRFDDRPIKVYAIGGSIPIAELKELADELASQLERIPGLTDAVVIGGEERLIRVLVNAQLLTHYGLSIDQVINAIRQSNTSIPIGMIERDSQEYSVRFDGTVVTSSDIMSLPITTPSGHTIFVDDVARIDDGYTERTSSSYIYKDGSGASAVTIQIFKKSSGNVLDVVKSADRVIEEARGGLLPDDVLIETVDDDAEFIKQDLTNLSSNGVQATLLVTILLFFLLGWREALIAGISVPLTYWITFIGLSVFGYTLNFLSLFSLILALGILIDSSIVMTEGIHEYRRQGLSPKGAVLKTIKEFEAPLTAGTFTTIFAFFPMMFSSGIVGEFIKSIPVTITLVLISAQIVALIFVPLMFMMLMDTEARVSRSSKYLTWILLGIGMSFLLLAKSILILSIGIIVVSIGLYDKYTKKITQNLFVIRQYVEKVFHHFYKYIENKREAIVERMRNAYMMRIQYMIDNIKYQKRLALSICVAFVCAMLLPILGILKIDMFAATDLDRIYIDITMPAGSVLASTESVMSNINTYLAGRAEIKSYQISSGIGSGLVGTNGVHRGSAIVNLVDRKSREDSRDYLTIYMRDLRDKVQNATIAVQQLNSGPESGAPVQVKIVGNELDVLSDLAMRVELILTTIPGTQNISRDTQDIPNEIAFIFNRSIMGSYGITPMQLASTLRTAIYGTRATSIRIDQEDVDIIVQYDLAKEERKNISIEQLRALSIHTSQYTVPLSTFLQTELVSGHASIEHEDGNRIMRVTSGVQKGIIPQEIFQALQKEIDKNLAIPEGYSVILAGQNEDTAQSFADLGRAMFLGIFLIAGLLVLEFNSFRQMFFILLSIPLALIGVFPGLALVNQPLSFPAMIGIVALSGIVVNNAILLIDRINENRRSEMNIQSAVIEACRSRLQPILLTAITTIIGLIPLAITQPAWAPLGYAIIFGMAFSTILTLVVIPLIYLRFAEKTALN